MRSGVRTRALPVAIQSAFDREINFTGLGAALWRKKVWVLGPTLVVAVLATIAVGFLTPRFKSETRIIYEGRESIFLRPEAERMGDRDRALLDQEAITSQVQLILSRDLARIVIEGFKLGDKPEFDPALRGVSSSTSWLALVGVVRDAPHIGKETRVLDSFFERLTAYQVEKSRVIAVEFQSADPELAAQVANAVIETYLGLQQAAKQDSTRSAIRWLSGEIDGLRAKVAKAEAAVEEFRARANLFVGTNNNSLSNQQLTETNTQLALAQTQKAVAEAKLAQIRMLLRTGQPVESSEMIGSELIRRMSEQRAVLRAQLAEQSSTLLEGHPRIKELRAQIGDLDRQLKAEAENLARGLESDAKIASARLNAMTVDLEKLKQRAATNSEQNVQLRALEREAKAQRELLEAYLAKYREATARDNMGAAPADARVVSRASAASIPYFPKQLPIVLMATLAMLALSAGSIVSRELLLSSPIMPEQTLEPAIEQEEIARAAVSRETAFDRAIRALAEQLSRSGEQEGRIVIIGINGESPSAATAIALARWLARSGRTMLADLAKTNEVARLAHIDDRPGMRELIGGASSFGAVMMRDRHSGAHVIVSGQSWGDDSELIASDRLMLALSALNRTYHVVLIHAGPLGENASRLARLAPRVVLVAPFTTAELIDDARTQLIGSGCRDVLVFDQPPPAEMDQRNAA